MSCETIDMSLMTDQEIFEGMLLGGKEFTEEYRRRKGLIAVEAKTVEQ